MRYIKTDEEKVMKGQQERNMKTMAKLKRERESNTTEKKQPTQKTLRKREAKAYKKNEETKKKEEEEFVGIFGRAKKKTVQTKLQLGQKSPKIGAVTQ